MRISGQVVERNVQNQRLLEKNRQDLNTFANENAKLLSAAKSQAQIEAKRRLQLKQAAKVEEDYENFIKQEEYNSRLKSRTLAQNQLLSNELDKEKSENERKLREIQRICEESPELRELESALRVAYLNKERKKQCEEKIQIAMREQERIQAIEDQMEYDRVNAIQKDNSANNAKRELFAKQREQLQQQIYEKQMQLSKLNKEKEIDKEIVDGIVDKINKEDEQEYKKRKDMQLRAQQMIKEFEIKRQREKQLLMLREKQEIDAINEYNKQNELRKVNLLLKKQEKENESNRILSQIIEDTEKKRKENEEFIQLRDMLWEEEINERDRQNVLNKQNRLNDMKIDMMNANSNILKQKEIQRKIEAENEAKLIVMMKNKFLNDEKIEAEKLKQQKSNQLNYKLEIEKQLADHQIIYDQERLNELKEIENNNKLEQYRLQVIREARKRLLNEHAEKLKGYLPMKALQNQDELEIIKEYK
mmetsp:Transcript_9263/g.8279  ORF Transcript_9263/g.8279 Transcript_9263/m.8279 type:complete len:476 (+) Transcript_9263:75-1502(+)